MKTFPTFLGLIAVLAIPAQAGRKPNILLIVADDLGYGELTSQGFTQEIPTPHIDSIAANGIRFTNGYVSGPYCSPTRAALLTGRYQQRFGHEFNPGPPVVKNESVGLPLTETTIGQRMKAAGYATGWFGKSHLGSEPPYHPQQRGFDEFYGFLYPGSHGYFSAGKGPNALLRGTEVVQPSGYLTETLASETVSFIERKKDTPWFVYLPFNAVHAPLEATAKYEDRFRSIQNPKRRKFAAMLSAMDDAVGSVLAKVRELNLEEDTLIYFISDNGGPTASITSGNGPLKGYKSQTSEGGIRVPFAIQWKGRIPAGKTDARPIIQLDLLPTSLAAAGVEVDPAWKLDGVNLLPYLTGDNTANPHEALFWRFGQQMAVRKGDWKLVKSQGDGIQNTIDPSAATPGGAKLYNLTEDIGEKNDLAATHPEKVQELAALWNDWNATLVDPKWTPPGLASKGGLIGAKKSVRKEAKGIAATASQAGPWKSGDLLSAEASPDVANKGFTITARIDGTEPPKGVAVAHGGHQRGYALHILDGKLAFSFRGEGDLTTITATDALPAGPRKLEAILTAGGQLTLKVDDKIAAEGKVAGLIRRTPGEGLSIGSDGRNPVGLYDAPNPFTGKVTEVSVTTP